MEYPQTHGSDHWHLRFAGGLSPPMKFMEYPQTHGSDHWHLRFAGGPLLFLG